MVLFRNWWKILSAAVAAASFLALQAAAIQAPAGTEVYLRLKTKVASNSSKVKDPIDAIVVQPVEVNGQFVIPAGAAVCGEVLEVKASTAADDRAMLRIAFTELELAGKKVKIASTLTDVDNARESVDSSGKIEGILASESISARLDAGIAKVTQRYSGLGDFLERAKGIVLHEPDGNIVYEPGVDLTIKLDQPLELNAAGGNGFTLQPPPPEPQLAALVTAQPFQTRAQSPPRPSDVTNLMFAGSQEQLEQAFAAAGWTSAIANNSISKFETFKAIAESRGYKEAPVSVLLLDGRPPDMVFQKQNNTFAQRHHLRIWRRPGSFRGQPVWVCAATHDIGIDFSQEDRTFIHKIDPQIDRERTKVLNDLLLAGQVKSYAMIGRPAVPKESVNATGDKLITDGQMAVILF